MLSTRNLVADAREIPDTWVFEYFAHLENPLDGAEVRIKSLFNPNDRTPSMYIFFSERLGKLWFHDFSTGKTGDGIRLVQELFRCSFPTACNIITREFALHADSGCPAWSGTNTGKKHKVSNYKIRKWNTDDAAYWTAFHIDSNMLDAYGICPLDWYEMKNEQGGEFEVSGGYLYGYFSKEGILYKIYRPKRANAKFIKVRNHLQGLDQLGNRLCLVIASSLKDGLSLHSLKLKVDFVAPDSENSLLSPGVMEDLKNRYQGRIVTLLDNDEAGIKAMKEYRKQYGVEPVLLALEKDLSDSIKKYGLAHVRNQLVPLIDRKLNDTG